MRRQVIRFMKWLGVVVLLMEGIKQPAGLFSLAKQKLRGDAVAVYRYFSKYTPEKEESCLS